MFSKSPAKLKKFHVLKSPRAADKKIRKRLRSPPKPTPNLEKRITKESYFKTHSSPKSPKPSSKKSTSSKQIFPTQNPTSLEKKSNTPTQRKNKSSKSPRTKSNPQQRPPSAYSSNIQFNINYEDQSSAIIIREDGTSLSRWPNKNIAVSIDKLGKEFTLYAGFSSGEFCASFESSGQGCVNYLNGSTCLTVSPRGGSLVSKNGEEVCSWNKAGKITQKTRQYDRGTEIIEKKLRREFGFRYHLKNKEFVLYWSCRHVRHAFLSGSNCPPYEFDPVDILFDTVSSRSNLKKKVKKVSKTTYSQELENLTSSLDQLTQDFKNVFKAKA